MGLWAILSISQDPGEQRPEASPRLMTLVITTLWQAVNLSGDLRSLEWRPISILICALENRFAGRGNIPVFL